MGKPLVTVAVLVAAAVVGGRVAGVGDVARLQTFLVIGTSIIIEALPFVVLGAAVSSAIEVFVPAGGSNASRGSRCRCRCPASRSRRWRCRCASAGRYRSRGG